MTHCYFMLRVMHNKNFTSDGCSIYDTLMYLYCKVALTFQTVNIDDPAYFLYFPLIRIIIMLFRAHGSDCPC